MKMIRSVVLVSVAILLGAAAMACGNYTVSGDAGGAGLAMTGDSTVNPGTSGTDVTSGAGGTNGSVNPGGTSGTNGTVNPGGSGGTDNPGGTGDMGGTDIPDGTGGMGGTDVPGGTGDMGGTDVPGGTGGTDEPVGPLLPGDVLNNAGLPVVSAHSTVRVIVSGYSEPLYQVCQGRADPGPGSCKSNKTQDIGIVEGGYADAAAQDAFCAGGGCTITKIYDQSGYENDIEPAPAGGFKRTPDNPANAAELPVKINGHSAYGILIKPDIGYRGGCNDCTKPIGNGVAVGDAPQTMYMVTSQHDLIDGCCFNYGNAEVTCYDDGNGTMEAVYFGGGVVWGTGFGGKPGPWVMADLENGLYAGWENRQDQNISTNTPLFHDFVTAIVVGDTADKNGGKGRFALYGGDATAGTVTTKYDGIRPEKPGYVPMQKQGSIILGIGGDNSNFAGGRFYEGIMSNGVATQDVVDALQESIVAAGYGR